MSKYLAKERQGNIFLQTVDITRRDTPLLQKSDFFF